MRLPTIEAGRGEAQAFAETLRGMLKARRARGIEDVEAGVYSYTGLPMPDGLRTTVFVKVGDGSWDDSPRVRIVSHPYLMVRIGAWETQDVAGYLTGWLVPPTEPTP